MIYVLKQEDLWLMVFIRPFGWLLWNVRSFHWALTICLTVVVAGGWDIRHRYINYNTFTGGSMNPCLCNRTGRICRCHQAHTCLLAQEGLICPRTSSSCLVWRVAELSFFNLVFEIPWLPYPTLYQNVMGVLQIGQTSISYIVNKLSQYLHLPTIAIGKYANGSCFISSTPPALVFSFFQPPCIELVAEKKCEKDHKLPNWSSSESKHSKAFMLLSSQLITSSAPFWQLMGDMYERPLI